MGNQDNIKNRLLTPFVPSTVKNEKLVEKRREQIVLAAIKLFGQKGFHGTTLRELAEEAGLSHGNIYDYVGSKEDIFFLLHEYMVDLVDNSLTKSIENVIDPVEKLRRMVRSEFNVMYEWADAILIIYQESHILKNTPLMKEFLQTEREHIAKFERVLQECLEKGICRIIKPRAIANLFKIMADSWVLKRWDLRDHVTQHEMESSILELALHGLLSDEREHISNHCDEAPLSGRLAIVVNGATAIGTAVSTFLVSKGVTVAKCDVLSEAHSKIRVFGHSEDSDRELAFSGYPLDLTNRNIFTKLSKKVGPIDFFVQDLGIGNIHADSNKNPPSAFSLENNLKLAQNISFALEKEMQKKGGGRIIYLAPWGWDKFVDPLGYHATRAAVVALTRTLSQKFAATKTSVNCIVPGFIGGSKPFAIQEKKRIELSNKIPMGCIGEMPDVLGALLFFLSDSAKYITGQVLEVAGGKWTY